MLELLLVRREDQQIFRDKRVRFLVFDEVHTYGGAHGIEVGCLIRRVREHVNRVREGLVCVGTSATVSGGALDEVAAFARKLFADTFTTDSIITERFDALPALTSPYWPLAPVFTEGDVREFDPSDFPAILHLAERLCGRSAQEGSGAAERIGDLLAQNVPLRLIEEHLVTPRSLDDLATFLGGQPERHGVPHEALVREIAAYLLVGSVAQTPEGPRL